MATASIPPPDILAAIAEYTANVFGPVLASATGYPQVYVDYLPSANPDGSPVVPPYAMVTEGPETYSAQSEDHESTGYWLSNIADGIAFIHFFAPSKSEARALCRQGVRLLSDTRAEPDNADDRPITLLPLRSEAVMQAGPGVVGEGQVYQRVLTVGYKDQFLE